MNDEGVLATTWWAVAHVDELAEVGSFAAREVGGASLIAVRNGHHSVRILENVCTHQQLPICASPGRGKVRSFQCPFHGWSFAIDGSYLPPVLPQLTSRHRQRDPAVVRSRRLREYETQTVRGVVFAALPEREASVGMQTELFDVSPRRLLGLLEDRYLDSMDVSQVRARRPWQAVYEDLRAAFGSEGFQRLAANAFAIVRGPDVHLVCAVMPRTSQGCTVALIRELEDGGIRPKSSLHATISQ